MLFTFAVSLGRTPVAFAQSAPPPSGGPGDAAAPTVVAPQLVEPAEAVYPPDALAARIEGVVGLRLTIAKTGQVVAADVVEPAGHGFDEAAVEAAMRFRYEPARRDGAPVAARILYRYEFKLPAPAPSAAPAPAPPAGPAPGRPAAPAPGRPAGPAPGRPAGPAPAPAGSSPKATGGGPQSAVEIVEDEPSPSQAAEGSATQPVEVMVRGKQVEAKRLVESADAVRVVDTHHAKQQTRDLGDVLASVEGVAIRRAGGLGSRTSFSLNGLYDEQIRFFIDGVPLDIGGSPFGISSVPLDAIERIEIYRGVLPVRFGADALGGAVNLVSKKFTDTNAYVSYQRASFGTHRATALGYYHHQPSGFVAGLSGWLDATRNDYDVDVLVADKTGRTSMAELRRFHDAYRSYGGSLQLGLVGKPWAQRLSLQLFGLMFDKEVQSDAIMTRAIGEAENRATSLGATIRYDQPISKTFFLSAVASGARQTERFVDLSDWVYDWYGKRVAPRNRPGELFGAPRDTTTWQDSGFGRALLEWRIRPEHVLRVTPTGRFTGRTGTETATAGQGGLDPNAGARNIFTLVSGLEYELNAFDMRSKDARSERPFDPVADDRLQNLFVLKHFFYSAAAKGVVSGLSIHSIDTSGHQFGVSDSLRFRFTSWLTLKVSYELASRVPGVNELFGDSLNINPNVDLTPETSHNANAGLQFEVRRTPVGNFTAEADGFLRHINGLIWPQPESVGVKFLNVGGVTVVGVEGLLKWISPGNWVVLDGNATWLDARNRSSEGLFAPYVGERIPNRPYLFANLTARVQWRRVLVADDGIALFYIGRYVQKYFRNWESIGDPETKLNVPTQLSHALGITYASQSLARTSITFEVDNLTDENVYEFFGLQRPGRSVSVKVTGEL